MKVTDPSSEASDFDNSWGRVTQIHSINRAAPPHKEQHLSADLADPLVSATATILAATTLGAIAVVLRHTALNWLGGIAGVFVAGLFVVFLLILGRAILRNHLIVQWQSKRQAWKELGHTRHSNELLRDLIVKLGQYDDRDLASSLDDFSTLLFSFVTRVDSKGGIIVAREKEGFYTVEQVRGTVGNRQGRIDVGKRCPSRRPFGEVLERLAPYSLAADARTPGGDVYVLGILVREPLDPAQIEMFSVVEPAFRLVLRTADASNEEMEVMGRRGNRYLSA
jgi:hypothetical protein